MKSLFNRVPTAFMAAGLLVAQVLMPVQAAYGDDLKPVYCNVQGQSGTWSAQISDGRTKHEALLKKSDGSTYMVENQNQVTSEMDALCQAQYGTPTIVITPVACTPGTNSTDDVTVKVTNAASLTAGVTYTVIVGAQNKTTNLLVRNAFQTLTFSGLSAGTHTVTVSGSDGTSYTNTVTVGACTAPTQNTVPAPTATTDVVCGPNNDTYTLSGYDSARMTMSTPAWVDGSMAITFTITAAGYTFADGKTTATIILNDEATACPVKKTQVTAVAGTISDECGIEFNLVVTSATTNGVTYAQTRTGNTVTVTATANEGYELINPEWTQVVTDELTACKPASQACTVSDNVFLSPWTYGSVKYPEAGGGYWVGNDWVEGGTPGSFTFVNDLQYTGLRITTPEDGSYVTGLIDAGNTRLDNIDALAYTTYRLPESAGYEQTLPAYILLIDKDSTNAPSVEDQTYLFFEPYHSELVQEGVWKTWDAYKNGDAIWYMSGTGQTLRTWDYFKANFPDATVLAYGFNQGTDNEGTYAYIKSMTFDCATTTFSAPGRGGAGGETPTTPTTPTLPTTPIIETPAQLTPGKGAVLPAELPKTGASFNYLSLAILVSVLTYGAVYFAQGKRQYE